MAQPITCKFDPQSIDRHRLAGRTPGQCDGGLSIGGETMSELTERADRIGVRFNSVAELVVRHGSKEAAMPYLQKAVALMRKASRKRSVTGMTDCYDAIDHLLDQAADTITAKLPA